MSPNQDETSGLSATADAAALSIVIPMFEEQGNVAPLLDELRRVLDPLALSYEIVLVNDGSRDGTWDEIRRAAEADARVKGVCFARNFGHQNALMAGLSMAAGQAVITMDGDLQHPPSLLPEMIRHWQAGAKVVATVRQDGAETGLLKRTTSRWFYRAFSYLAEVPVGEGASDFRLLDRQVLDNLLRLQHPNLFLRGAVTWLGFRSVNLPYQVAARHAGQSKYSWRRMIRFATTAVLSFSTRPLLIAVWVGLLTSLAAFAELVFVFIQYLRGGTVPGWASTLTLISFLFGVLFLLLGIIGAYLGSVHQALQNRPLFVVDTTVNLEAGNRNATMGRNVPR
jgi:dolichol-phosphate mannosyltransferase